MCRWPSHLDHDGARSATGSVICTGIRNLGALPMRGRNSPSRPRRRRSMPWISAGGLVVQHVDIDERDPGRRMAGPQADIDAGPAGPPLDRLRIVRIVAPVGQQRPPALATVPAPCLGRCRLRPLFSSQADVWLGIVRQQRQQPAPALILQLERQLAGAHGSKIREGAY